MLFATLIGYERHRSFKEAGVRTHVLVALSTCLLMIVSKYGFADVEKVDASRIAAGVVSGISFLGAGIIFERRGKIEGLTTAAGVFATGAIGMCFGAGLYLLGVFSGFLTLLIVLLSPVFNYNRPSNIVKISVHMDADGLPENIDKCLLRLQCYHTENHIRSDEGNGWYLETEIVTHDNIVPKDLIAELEKVNSVLDVKIK
ncbi:MAG: MgtC/SapB family protein [Erysipelotrichaceae bacterium]|nr:MgtC/SapB family protein [Erysipelotrichaceae bacterium]